MPSHRTNTNNPNIDCPINLIHETESEVEHSKSEAEDLQRSRTPTHTGCAQNSNSNSDSAISSECQRTMSGFSLLGSKQLGLRHCSGGARSSEAAPITFQFDNVHMSLSLTMTVTQPLPCNGPVHDTNSYPAQGHRDCTAPVQL